MAAGRHFKVIKGKTSEGVKQYSPDKYRSNFDKIFKKKKQSENEN